LPAFEEVTEPTTVTIVVSENTSGQVLLFTTALNHVVDVKLLYVREEVVFEILPQEAPLVLEESHLMIWPV
jgi:hypothetical protein